APTLRAAPRLRCPRSGAIGTPGNDRSTCRDIAWGGAGPALSIRCQRAAEAVAKTVIGANGRQRPVGVATIERKIGKLLKLKTACGVRTAHDAARRLVSKVGHHGHAAAIAAKRIVHST